MTDFDMDELRRDAAAFVGHIDGLMDAESRWHELAEAVAHLEELIARQVLRDSRWLDLKRHLRFRKPVDWADVVRSDWPSLRRLLAPASPLPTRSPELGA